MSVQSQTYDWAVAPTLSDTVDDPAGAFAGLYVAATGNVVIWNRNGPQGANPITLVVVAGQYVRWPVRRVGLSTTAIVYGLVASNVRQGT